MFEFKGKSRELRLKKHWMFRESRRETSEILKGLSVVIVFFVCCKINFPSFYPDFTVGFGICAKAHHRIGGRLTCRSRAVPPVGTQTPPWKKNRKHIVWSIKYAENVVFIGRNENLREKFVAKSTCINPLAWNKVERKANMTYDFLHTFKC